MKKKIIGFSIALILIIIIVFSFIISFLKDKELEKKREEIQELVLSYLEKKYNEEFELKDYYVEKVPYEMDVLSDDGFDKSNFYVMKFASTRLVNFDVVYVEYLDENVFLNNKENDIMEPGIYDNYIYEYKRKNINSELREEIISIMGDVKDIDVSFTDIGNYYINNLLIRQSLDSEEEIVLYNKYLSFDKTISNLDFYNTVVDITNGDLIVDIEINDYIDENNLSDFKKKVKKIVSYIQEMGYVNYDINFIFNKYQSAEATRYFGDDEEQIYLIFDYDMYSNEADDTKLGAYILDK